MKVLIVDDDKDNRTVLRYYFEHQRFEIAEACDGQEGLDLAVRERPDIIVSDALMPKMDGFQFLRELKKNPNIRDIPFVFYSAIYSGSEEADLAASLGAAAFIVKPKTPDEFWNELMGIIDRCNRSRVAVQAETTIEQEQEFLKQYSQVVAHKLEQKISELEEALALREKAEKELRVLNASLRERVAEEVQKNRAKDRIMYEQARHIAMGDLLVNIAHQWRQPLNRIGLLAQGIEDMHRYNELTGDDLARAVSKIMDELQELSGTIDDFRGFYVHEKARSRFKLASAVRRAIAFIDADFKGSNICMDIDMDEEAEAEGYFNEFSQVVLNILNNIRDVFSERKARGGIVRIRLWKDASVGKSLLSISDNGGGIPQDVIGRIFDPYFTTKHKARGTGLGLYMARVIIEDNMGGSIRARNTEDGAEFSIVV